MILKWLKWQKDLVSNILICKTWLLVEVNFTKRFIKNVRNMIQIRFKIDIQFKIKFDRSRIRKIVFTQKRRRRIHTHVKNFPDGR